MHSVALSRGHVLSLQAQELPLPEARGHSEDVQGAAFIVRHAHACDLMLVLDYSLMVQPAVSLVG
jgi:hypothetical protein